MGDAAGKHSSVRNGEQGPCRHLILLLPRLLLCFSEDFLKFQMHSLELGFASLILMYPRTFTAILHRGHRNQLTNGDVTSRAPDSSQSCLLSK